MALVDEVKNRSDIVQVISDYVDLDTSSRQPKALCPFHSERTPSLSYTRKPATGTASVLALKVATLSRS